MSNEPQNETPKTPQPEGVEQPKVKHIGRWKFGRGVYGSKDVPIRALDTLIVCLGAAIVILVVIGTITGGFHVNFDTGLSDVKIEMQKVRNGQYVTEPEAPVRPGYTLVCWSTDSQEQIPWSFAYSTVSSDMTLYAVWTPAEYTVSFDLGGGTVGGQASAEPITVTYGETIGSLPTPEKEGASFAGWNCAGSMITADSVVSFTSDTVLTAVWQ